MKRILVVDDKEETLALLKALLSGSGYAVDTARHGAEALVTAHQTPPDLVVSDLLMPVMDGYTLLRRWKADPRLHRIPFVVYTATFTDPEDERLARDFGADAFILKPAEPVEFLARLEDVLLTDPSDSRAPRAADEQIVLREYNASLVRKIEGKLVELEAANRALTEDVAARRALERALTESETRLRDLIDGLGPDVFVGLLTPAGEILEANRSALAAAGLTLENVLGRPVEQTYWFSHDPDAQRQLRDAVTRAARGEGSRFDVPVRLAGGRSGVLDFSVQPLRDDAGIVRFLVPSAVLITERKRAEQRLQESERRFREIFESANVGIAVADRDDRFLAVNAWFGDMLGYTRDELLQMHTFDLVHPDDVAESRRLTTAVHEGRAGANWGGASLSEKGRHRHLGECLCEHRVRRMRPGKIFDRRRQRHHRAPARGAGAARERGALFEGFQLRATGDVHLDARGWPLRGRERRLSRHVWLPARRGRRENVAGARHVVQPRRPGGAGRGTARPGGIPQS
jgi:PAS domain S-box-containing protein